MDWRGQEGRSEVLLEVLEFPPRAKLEVGLRTKLEVGPRTELEVGPRTELEPRTLMTGLKEVRLFQQGGAELTRAPSSSSWPCYQLEKTDRSGKPLHWCQACALKVDHEGAWPELGLGLDLGRGRELDLGFAELRNEWMALE